jgi:hypothetical protein
MTQERFRMLLEDRAERIRLELEHALTNFRERGELERESLKLSIQKVSSWIEHSLVSDGLREKMLTTLREAEKAFTGEV